MTAAEEQAPFHTLIKMIERELDLAQRGLLDELAQAVAETGAVIATRPTPAPPSAESRRGTAHNLGPRARRYGGPRATRISTSA